VPNGLQCYGNNGCITVVKMYMIKVFRSCLVKNMYVHECHSLSPHKTYENTNNFDN